MNTEKIVTADQLFDREFILSVFDIEDIGERQRNISLLTIKAAEFGSGVANEFKKVINSYTKEETQLNKTIDFQSAKAKSMIDFDRNADGKILSTINNFLLVMESDSFFAGLKFNLLTHSPEQFIDGVRNKWTDADDAKARYYIEKIYGFHSERKCDDALRIIFAQNQYHPIRDIIDNLEWDGTSRIYDFLHYATKSLNDVYTREVSRLIFAGGINRLYNPGCKFDDMPVLIGTKQGEGKSTLIRWLALNDEWFTDVSEFEGQRGIEALEGAWICEVGEMLALTKTKEQEAIKAYLSRLVDRYRRPFDKRVTDHPRQCIFIGTTNKEQFLTDKTGGRRFYPVKVNQSGYDLFDRKGDIKAYILQCWAEAKCLYDKGELKPYADRTLKDVIKQHQQDASEDDYRVELIQAYLETSDEVCVMELWKNALVNEYTKPSKKDSNEISLIMQNYSEWEKQKNPKRFGEFGLAKWWKKIPKITVTDEEMNSF